MLPDAGFQTFPDPRRRSTEPAASLWSGGIIAINPAAVRRYQLDRFTHVLLQYNPATRMIGLKCLTDGRSEHAVRLVRRGKSLLVSAKAFLHHYRLDSLPPARCRVAYDAAEQRVAIQLDELLPNPTGRTIP